MNGFAKETSFFLKVVECADILYLRHIKEIDVGRKEIQDMIKADGN